MTTAAAIQTNPAADLGALFEQSHPHIQRFASAFARRYGFDFDECVSLANMLFCEIANEMPEGRTWLAYLKGCLWRRWIDAYRTSRAKYRGNQRDEALNFLVVEPHQAIDITEFGDDAWLVASLTINPPDAVAEEARKRGNTHTNFRSCLRKYLTEELNWDANRINTAFTEIADRLAGKG